MWTWCASVMPTQSSFLSLVHLLVKVLIGEELDYARIPGALQHVQQVLHLNLTVFPGFPPPQTWNSRSSSFNVLMHQMSDSVLYLLLRGWLTMSLTSWIYDVWWLTMLLSLGPRWYVTPEVLSSFLTLKMKDLAAFKKLAGSQFW